MKRRQKLAITLQSSAQLPDAQCEDTDDFDYYREIAREAIREVERSQERDDKFEGVFQRPKVAARNR
jgi:hypothetical protein